MKWTQLAIDNYKAEGERLKTLGYRAMREIKDKDCGTVFTLWTGRYQNGSSAEELHVVIQQTWIDTGDVVLYRQAEVS